MSEQAPTDREAIRPREQLPFTYFGSVVLAARHPDGTIYLSVRDLCDVLGVSRASQMRRLRQHADLGAGLALFLVHTPGGPQAQEFLALEKVPAWLLGISARARSEEVRSKLGYLQAYLVREVYAAYARIAGLPEQASRQIEDLEDVQRLDTSLSALAERQARIEASQDKAREAWRSLSSQVREIVDRLTALEQQEGAISKAQRGHLYQLVQAWGSAKVEQEPRLSRSAAFQAVWTAFKVRFGLARYEDLPAARYREALRFVQDSYRALTGRELELPEQGELDLS